MSSMLEPFIPDPRVLERERVAVVSDVAKTWSVIRHVDAYRSSFVRALFALRRLPDLLSGRLTGVKAALTPHASVDDFAAPGSDFQLLADVPGQGFVVGAVGRLWQPHLEFHHVAPHDFAAFALPGHSKLAWGLSVTKRRSGGSWVTFELRVARMDEESEAAFERSWPLIAPFAHAIRTAVLGLVQKQLGAIDPAHLSLPGDLLIPARISRTASVVIEAPPLEVWPWLAQMGCHRAGWYGLDQLDNGGLPSARALHPEWQELTVGQRIAATPDRSSELEVLLIDPGRALVFGSPRHGSSSPGSGEEFKLTWAFVLEGIGEDACWLGARVRATYEPSLDVALRHGWEALVHQAAQHAQLRHLKERVEKGPAMKEGRGDERHGPRTLISSAHLPKR